MKDNVIHHIRNMNVTGRLCLSNGDRI